MYLTVDPSGHVCIDIPSRVKAIATLSNIEPILEDKEYTVDTLDYSDDDAVAGDADRWLLPLPRAVESSVNAYLDNLGKSSNAFHLPKLPKPPTVTITPYGWAEPAGPSKLFQSLGRIPSPDELAKATVNVKVSQLHDWEKASRQVMGALAYGHYTSKALVSLIKFLCEPKQHLPSFQALTSGLLVLDLQNQKAILANNAFLMTSFHVLRRDYFLKGLYARTCQVPDLVRDLRLSHISSSSVFGDSEKAALAQYEGHMQREANASLAGGSQKDRARSTNKTASSSRKRSRSRDRPSSANRGPAKPLSVAVPGKTAPARRVTFDQPKRDARQDKPFSAPHRGKHPRGRGGTGRGKPGRK